MERSLFFIFIKGTYVCIDCNENISVVKEYSIIRHYEGKYASQLCCMQGKLRWDKITRSQNLIAQQQNLITSSILQSGTAVPTSYVVSEILGKNETF